MSGGEASMHLLSNFWYNFLHIDIISYYIFIIISWRWLKFRPPPREMSLFIKIKYINFVHQDLWYLVGINLSFPVLFTLTIYIVTRKIHLVSPYFYIFVIMFSYHDISSIYQTISCESEPPKDTFAPDECGYPWALSVQEYFVSNDLRSLRFVNRVHLMQQMSRLHRH